MIFLLLPFIFSPVNFAMKWLPALYLAAWPIIIQTLGREALMTHATILILFILACDVTRATMLRVIGIDLISLPVGIALLATLLSENGLKHLSYITPFFSGLLVIAEPILLIIETKIVMDMIRTFNKWISKLANIHDDISNDISSWEPPLSRGSMVVRILMIMMSVACYIGTYMIIQESKALLGADDNVLPIQFNHAIALLVTLQLIAFSATIYKEEGILSETAIVALTASVPIFIASWSYHHLKLTNANARSPMQLLQDWNLSGLTREKLARYYFGPDFWYILGTRLVCLTWWSYCSSKSCQQTPTGGVGASSASTRSGSRFCSLANETAHDDDNDDDNASFRGLLGSIWNKFKLLPIDTRCLIKIVFVLAYAQMLDQQMENRINLEQQSNFLDYLLGGRGAAGGLGRENYQLYERQVGAQLTSSSSCCQSSVSSAWDSNYLSLSGAGGDSFGASVVFKWFNCLWNCASRACALGQASGSDASESKASRLLYWMQDLFGQLAALASALLASAYGHLINAPLFLYSMNAIWLSRWRSPIIQRLIQSILIHLHYIVSLMFLRGHHHHQDDQFDARH